jgi:hypothetical protein
LATFQFITHKGAISGEDRMKRSRIVGLVILIVVVVALALNYGGLRRTFAGLRHGDFGLWLTGNVVNTPVTDWSFIDAVSNVQLETRTWYLIPHFVRTDIARNGAQLYLFSEYFAPAPGQPDLRDRFPEARFWNRMVVRDPRVHVKIGDRVFQMRAYPLTDTSGMEIARQEFLNKYADVRETQSWPESRRPRLYFFRLEQGWNDNR